MMSVPVCPAASCAVTVITLSPSCKDMPGTDQEVVPDAVPDPPVLFAQLTWVTPTLSEADPPSLDRMIVVLGQGVDVGGVRVIVGYRVSGGE